MDPALLKQSIWYIKGYRKVAFTRSLHQWNSVNFDKYVIKGIGTLLKKVWYVFRDLYKTLRID